VFLEMRKTPGEFEYPNRKEAVKAYLAYVKKTNKAQTKETLAIAQPPLGEQANGAGDPRD